MKFWPEGGIRGGGRNGGHGKYCGGPNTPAWGGGAGKKGTSRDSGNPTGAGTMY